MGDLNILAVCTKCGAKCCKLGGSNFSTKERNAIIHAGYPDYTKEISTNHWEFISKKGICPYLNKNNSCGIYEVRPLACKCFPVHPEIKNGKKEYYLSQCPLGKILPKEMISQMKKDISKYPDKIIKERLEKSNISKEDFVLIKKRLKDLKSIKIK
ncbi:MAG: YkgJ family cysteine cluster protein [archaeon]|nr:YkgJ family cysteine cluster protein [archaeon]MCR4323365.1 YkgJ family cysteine cluster protein [Nanoarchaeota archaeon]